MDSLRSNEVDDFWLGFISYPEINRYQYVNGISRITFQDLKAISRMHRDVITNKYRDNLLNNLL